MRARITLLLVAACLAAASVTAGAATASPSATTQIKTLYKAVLTAEYFGPASGVCSHLTAAGVKSYTAFDEGASCTKTFAQVQHTLTHKTAGVDDSGYTASQWRTVVKQVMAGIKITIKGTKASAIGGESGIPGKTTLVEVKGAWYFDSYPPSVSS